MENDFLNGVYVEEWEHSGKSDRFLCPDFKKPNGKNEFSSYNHNNDKVKIISSKDFQIQLQFINN